ncbi:MAG: LiaI-LiaF-like domain-containing protein, partial [Candidatus Acidiferrales bacterium]
MSNDTGTTYRRGSVFGALLLIGIGFLFLYANINSEFNPWTLLARYWPVLIIFWGLSRLADYFILRGTDQAAAVTRIGAGDIIGLIFILIFGTILTQVINAPWGDIPFRVG